MERGCVADQPQPDGKTPRQQNSGICCGWARATHTRAGGFRQILTQQARLVRGNVLLLFACTALTATAAASHPFVSPMFGDHMVLQRGKTNTIWGWAAPGQKVEVQVAGQSASGIAGSNGRWQVLLPAPAMGGPYTLRISGPQSVAFHDILCGDVWLCGGQSNMEFPLSRANNGQQAIQTADHPHIRLFTVKTRTAYAPVAVVHGSWKVCSPQTVTEDGGFSAVGYFFGLKIHSETNVPIGLVQDCVGGTPAESWTSAQTLHQLKDFDVPLREVARLHAEGAPEYGNYIMHWYDTYDIGQKGKTWEAPDLDDRDWKAVTIPGGFRDLGVADVPSVCYFRKNITLPDPLPSGPAFIRLGVVERMDTTYINGHWVGASAWVENPRFYRIGNGILKPGTNEITVRVFKTKPNGGFESKPGQLQLILGDKTRIPLAGEWKGKVSVNARPPHPMPLGFENWPVMPGVLYNGMIAPVAPFALTGAIWYQGEANASRAYQYRKLLPAMIRDWRKTFDQGNFPFYIVSLASFMPHRDTPGDDWWAELREAQALTASRVTNSGLAVAIDIGSANTIHPTDKIDVGNRLAWWALAKQYGKQVVCSGPTFASVQHLRGALKLHFNHTNGGLMVKGGKLGEFSVAGADHKWYWADAKIEGDAVVVSSPKVPHPVAARYAWQANPVATLYNGAGLPAVPFRTDHWPESTQDAKPY